MIVHGATPSPFVRKVIVALEEKGIPYSRKELVPFPKTPQLLAMHPMGKIPVLEHEGRFIPDSSVICAYLEKIHPLPALYPDDPAELAQALFLEEYADTRMVDVIGGILFGRLVKPRFFQRETDEARVRELLEQGLPPVMEYLESVVPSERGSALARFSIADAALGTQLGSLAFADIAIDATRWPRTARYCRALHARPSFQRATAV
jgi:glutathione S-transferase